MGRAQPVSESELEIMQVLWKHDGRMMLSPMMETLETQGKKWKTNTVLTFLSRLSEKGMIRTEKEGRLNHYVALCTEEDYLDGLTLSFVNDVYGGDAKGLVAALLKQDSLSSQDMEELRTFWEEGGQA